MNVEFRMYDVEFGAESGSAPIYVVQILFSVFSVFSVVKDLCKSTLSAYFASGENLPELTSEAPKLLVWRITGTPFPRCSPPLRDTLFAPDLTSGTEAVT